MILRAAIVAAVCGATAGSACGAAPSALREPLAKGSALELLGGTSRPVSSLLRTSGRMRFGDFVWNASGASGPVWIRVDLERQLLSVFMGRDEVGSAVVIYGADGTATPRGAFRILERRASHRSSLYDAEMPFSLRITDDGVAIHASDVRSGRATHGCVGVPPEFARRLFEATRRGDAVYVV